MGEEFVSEDASNSDAISLAICRSFLARFTIIKTTKKNYNDIDVSETFYICHRQHRNQFWFDSDNKTRASQQNTVYISVSFPWKLEEKHAYKNTEK